MSNGHRHVRMDEAYIGRFADHYVAQLVEHYGWPTNEDGKPLFEKSTVKTSIKQLIEVAQDIIVTYKNGASHTGE